MSNACTPILVGRAPLVSELWLLSVCLQKRPKFPFGPWTIVHGGQKINCLKLAQKIHASRGWCQMHAHKFWLAELLRFRSYGSFLFAFKNGQKKLNYINYAWHSNKCITTVSCMHTCIQKLCWARALYHFMSFIYLFLLTCNCSHVVKWWSESNTIASVQ